MSVLALEEVLQLVTSNKHHHCIEVRYFVHTEKLTLYQDIGAWSASCWIELKDRLHRNTKGSVENKLDGLNEFNGVLRLGLGQSNLCHISKTLCTKPKQKLRLNITLNCSLWGQVEWNLISWQSCVMQISYSMLVYGGAGMMPGDRDYRQAGDESGGCSISVHLYPV